MDQFMIGKSSEQIVDGLFYEQFRILLWQRDFIVDYVKRYPEFKQKVLDQKNVTSFDQLFRLIENVSQNQGDQEKESFKHIYKNRSNQKLCQSQFITPSSPLLFKDHKFDQNNLHLDLLSN